MSETLQEQTDYRYHLTLARFEPEVESGGFFHLQGTITNIGRTALDFATEHHFASAHASIRCRLLRVMAWCRLQCRFSIHAALCKNPYC